MRRNYFWGLPEFGNFESMIERMLDAYDDERAWRRQDEDEENGQAKSHVREKSARYENGKLVEKHEREYVDGKCVKNESFTADKLIGDNSPRCHKGVEAKRHHSTEHAPESTDKWKDSKIEKLEEKLIALQNKSKELESELTILRSKNEHYKELFDKIKDSL